LITPGTLIGNAIYTNQGYIRFGDSVTITPPVGRYITSGLNISVINASSFAFGITIGDIHQTGSDGNQAGGLSIGNVTNFNVYAAPDFTYGIRVGAVTSSDTSQNVYGLRLGDVTSTGGQSAYAIYTGAGLVRFGGNTTINGSLTVTSTISFTGVEVPIQTNARTWAIKIGNKQFTPDDANGLTINTLTTATNYNLAGIGMVSVQSTGTGASYGLNILSVSAVAGLAHGVNVIAVTAGSGGSAFGVRIQSITGTTANTLYGLRVGNMSGSTVASYGLSIGTVAGTGTNYGIHINTVSGGTTNYGIHSVSGINTEDYYYVAGTKVVGDQGTAIVNANTAHSVNNFTQTNTALNALGSKINVILAAIRASTGHGLISG
jgi:hypothetical protein